MELRITSYPSPGKGTASSAGSDPRRPATGAFGGYLEQSDKGPTGVAQLGHVPQGIGLQDDDALAEEEVSTLSTDRDQGGQPAELGCSPGKEGHEQPDLWLPDPIDDALRIQGDVPSLFSPALTRLPQLAEFNAASHEDQFLSPDDAAETLQDVGDFIQRTSITSLDRENNLLLIQTSTLRPGPVEPQPLGHGVLPAEQIPAPNLGVSSTGILQQLRTESADLIYLQPNTVQDQATDPGLVGGEVAEIGGFTISSAEAYRADRSLASPVPGNHPVAQLANAIVTSKAGETELTLSPEELGQVRFSIKHTESGLQVIIAAERPEILSLLRRNSDLLSGELAQMGVSDSNIQFWNGSESDRDGRHDSPGRNTGALRIDAPVDEVQQPLTYLSPSGHLNIRI